MVEVLGKPVEGLTEAELTGARRRALAAFWRSLAAPASLADELTSLGVRRAPDDALKQQLDALQSSDAAAVQRASQRPPGGLVAVAVGDATRVAPLLTRWGEVTVVDPVTLERRRVVSP
ncbi:MAG: hypothetical protein EOO75_10465 [Myxococcales bacterium]|nr:MAG: hypothetical protein EOO75_10465 [Myxococcales bacterium]